MKPLLLAASLLVADLLGAGCQRQAGPADADAVNDVLGDVSYVRRFGMEPGSSADEQIRISTHLRYVEELLRHKGIRRLPNQLRRRRYLALKLLHQYRVAGQFPRNYDYPNERRPCFIDRDGRICAVGYLIEQTAGRELAEKINQRHQYDRITDMHLPELQDWVKASGLTLDELAMIQPTYGPSQSNTNYVEPLYGAASAAWSGLNAPLAALNGVRLAQGQPSKGLAVTGLISGAGQVVLGVLTLPDETRFNAPPRNESRKAVSYLNIGLGTSTMVLNAWNLLGNRPPTPAPRTTLSLNTVPAPNGQPGYVLRVTRRL